MSLQSSENGLETLEYIESMLIQLHSMARAQKLDMLAYLIEMAQLEASDAVRSATGSPIRKQNRNRTA